ARTASSTTTRSSSPPRSRRRACPRSGRRCMETGTRRNGSPLALPRMAEGASYDVAVVGAGYVGVPLAATFAEADCRVLLVDVLDDVVAALNRGESHIVDVPSERLAPLVERGLIHATTEYVEVGDADAIVIALPTPLSRQREPDLSIVESAAGRLGEVLREGQVVVLESTTWPGTT